MNRLPGGPPSLWSHCWRFYDRTWKILRSTKCTGGVKQNHSFNYFTIAGRLWLPEWLDGTLTTVRARLEEFFFISYFAQHRKAYRKKAGKILSSIIIFLPSLIGSQVHPVRQRGSNGIGAHSHEDMGSFNSKAIKVPHCQVAPKSSGVHW